jgi:RNA recognition motif-containing protein
MLQVSIAADAALWLFRMSCNINLTQHVRFALTPAGKPKGFAFASFMCHADAERAIALVNKQVMMSFGTG